MRLVALLMALLFLVCPAWAAVEQPTFAPKIGTQIDLSTPLTDSGGTTESLGAYMAGRPALVIFGYHDCPNLCGVVQAVVAQALTQSGLSPKDYEPLFITVAPEEGPSDARGAKQRLADAAGTDAAAPWAFLSGPKVTELSETFGIGSLERQRIEQYVHPVAVFALTPDGRIARVLPGVEIKPEDLRLALVEASAGTLGTVIDQIVLFCAGYDITKGQYGSLIDLLLKVACFAVVLLGLGGIGYLRWRETH